MSRTERTNPSIRATADPATRAVRRIALFALAAVALFGCQRADEGPRPVAADGLRFEAAGPGEVADIVHAGLGRAAAADRRLLVYVGAGWCPPCIALKNAAHAGKLDDALPKLTLLEFDVDVDQDRLARAGYVSPLVPMFVVPNPDGTASPNQTQGARRGGDYVAELAPRIKALLAQRLP